MKSLAWPRTLTGRLTLLLSLGLMAAQALTFALVVTERGLAMRGMMVSYMAADVASSIAMLDRLPPAERVDWLPRLQRDNYRLRLEKVDDADREASSSMAAEIAHALSQALSQPVRAASVTGAGVASRLTLRLRDGTPVVVDLAERRFRISPWAAGLLAAQLTLLAAACALAVRQATRPLARLAQAAATLSPGQSVVPLPETGPTEVAQASAAFNRMCQRIDAHLDERTQMLAAISHDLQTPITRMRLRADLLADDDLRDRLQADLAQMQHLVAQGLAYARSAHAPQEPEVPTDLVALLESLVADYRDAGQPVRWQGGAPCTLCLRPHTLRRAVGNLIDNALKFAGQTDVVLDHEEGRVAVRVMDRGPGIAVEELDKVLQPFYRVESSRNTATGGSGLGLAIVQRLLAHCHARLRLAPREGGGLVACVCIDTRS